MSAIFGEELSFGQQNGPDVVLRVFGDEHYAVYEDLNGFTVVYDFELGLFCYARLNVNEFASTKVPIASPPPPGIVRHLRESEAMIQAKAEARRLTMLPPVAQALGEIQRTLGPNGGLLNGRQLSVGTVRGLTILVNFRDITSTVTRQDVDDLLNADNFTGNGNICSAREYFRRVSSGRLDYTNTVAGPFTLSRDRQFYADTLMVQEALQLAVNAGVDLSQFDSRNEGIIDALNILYAGQTQYFRNLWPHNGFIDLRFGNIRTNLYLLTSLGRRDTDLTIGTFCHENGHLLCRFPDMYDYGERDGDTVRSAGIGSYCLMGSGNHLGDGKSPSPVCAYLRDLAGWCPNEVDLSAGGSHEARHGDYSTVMRFPSSKANEYFLVENRTRTGLDRDLPASGLAVYHCDIFGSNELQEGSPTRHYQCALLQADGRLDLESDANGGDGGDLFANAAGIVLSSESNPHSREWDGRDSGLVIADISGPGEVMTFHTGGAAEPQTIRGEAAPDMVIPDNRPEGIASVIAISESGVVSRIRVGLDITHPFIGDLQVELFSPTSQRAVLHSRFGGSADNIVSTFDSSTLGQLGNLVGQSVQGNWILRVSDRARRDVGKLNRWSLEITTASVGVLSSAAVVGGGG